MDEKKELEKMKKELAEYLKNGFVGKFADKLNLENIKDNIKELLNRMIPDMQESEDIAYVMTKGYLEGIGCKVHGDEVYGIDGKKIAEIRESSWDGANLSIKLKHEDPMHFIVANIKLGNINKDKK